MNRLEEAEEVGKSELEQNERRWQERVHKLEAENILLKEKEREATEEYKVRDLPSRTALNTRI